MLSVLALIYELTIFSFYNWFIDAFICVQVLFAISNLGFLISHEDTQAFWLQKRRYFIYTPFCIMLIITIVQLALVGSQLLSEDDDNSATDNKEDSSPHNKEEDFKLYATLALFIPTIPIVG